MQFSIVPKRWRTQQRRGCDAKSCLRVDVVSAHECTEIIKYGDTRVQATSDPTWTGLSDCLHSRQIGGASHNRAVWNRSSSCFFSAATFCSAVKPSGKEKRPPSLISRSCFATWLWYRLNNTSSAEHQSVLLLHPYSTDRQWTVLSEVRTRISCRCCAQTDSHLNSICEKICRLTTDSWGLTE